MPQVFGCLATFSNPNQVTDGDSTRAARSTRQTPARIPDTLLHSTVECKEIGGRGGINLTEYKGQVKLLSC
jgi:hypothetical protein